MTRRLLLLILLIAVSTTSADESECSKIDAYAAERATEYLNNWENVHLFFRQFGDCYEASIADGAEDRIHKLLADHWDVLPEMLELAKKDDAFKAFIWQRIEDETFSRDRFLQVVHHAKDECPSIATEFCNAVLAESARGAKIQ